MVKINRNMIGDEHPVYFIADIASNHCGDLVKAKELIHACVEAGANAVKMQNFTAATIVSDYGFKTLSGVATHQSKWKQSVYASYDAASIPFDWTFELRGLCDSLGVDYFTSPYSLDLTRAVASHVSAFKVGSGDITWHESLKVMAGFGLPVLLATGASDFSEVRHAMEVLLAETDQVVLLQCNTDYTANPKESEAERRNRFSNINLRVLETYKKHWPAVPVGLSDHTHGSLTVLAAVGLFGCSVVEKHFTLDNSLEGQDHSFSMTPVAWRSMVDATVALKGGIRPGDTFEQRLAKTAAVVDHPEYLELVVGDGVKKLEENEQSTVIVQRRAVRSARALEKGTTLQRADLCVLRPCPSDALPPYRLDELVGKKLAKNIEAGDCVRLCDLD